MRRRIINSRRVVRHLILTGFFIFSSCSLDHQEKAIRKQYLTADSALISDFIMYSDTAMDIVKANFYNNKAKELINTQIQKGTNTRGFLSHLCRNLTNSGYFSGRFNNNPINEVVYYYKALGIADWIADPSLKAGIHNNLGFHYSELRNFEMALYHYKLAVINYQLVNNTTDMAVIYNNMGQMLLRMKDTASSIKSFQNALSVASSNTSAIVNQVANASLNSIGTIHLGQKKHTLALTYIWKAISSQKQINDEYGLILSLINIGDVYSNINRIDSAEYYYRKASHKADSIDDTELIVHSTEVLMEFYKKKKDKQHLPVLEQKLKAFQLPAEKLEEMEVKPFKTDTFYLNGLKAQYVDSIKHLISL